jgi:hypothetical protein
MIKLRQLKHAALLAPLAFQAGCTDSDIDSGTDEISSTDSELAASPEIRNSMNNKCLDVLGFDNSNGARVGMWDCWGGSNQHWYWNGEEIRSSMNSKCLDLLGFNNNNGAEVGMWDCWGGSNQHWYWDGSQIRSRLNGKCLDLLGFNNNNGAHVGVWDCWGGANQHWYQ